MKRKLLYTALALSVFAPPGMAETIATASGRLVPVKAWKATHSGPVVPAEIEATCKEIIARVNSAPHIPRVFHSLEHAEGESTYRCFMAEAATPTIPNGIVVGFEAYCPSGYASYPQQPPYGGKQLMCVVSGTSCPSESGWTMSADKRTCTRPDPKEFANAGPGSCRSTSSAPNSQFIDSQTNSATGSKVETQTDLSIPGASELNFSRIYNSRYLPSSKTTYPWVSSFQQYAEYDAEKSIVSFYRPQGTIQAFSRSGNNWQATTNTVDTLTELKNAQGQRTGWQYKVSADGTTEQYDAQGKLQSLTKLNGKTVTLTYSDGSQKAISDVDGQTSKTSLPIGVLIKATNQFGQALQFTYNERFMLKQVSGPSDKKVSYRYEAFKDVLTEVTQSDGSTRQYRYESDFNPAFLTGIINEQGQRTLSVSYDSNGRAISTEYADGVNKYQIAYQTDGSTKVTDPLGTVRTYNFGNFNGVIKTTDLSQPCPTGCGNSGKHTSYDAQGNPTRIVDWSGFATEYSYDTARGLELRRTEGLKDIGGSNSVQLETRTTLTTWHATLPVPLTISEYSGGVNASGQPSGTLQRQTVYTYDSAGNALTRIEKSGSDSRQWQYQYTSFGRITSATDPDGASIQYSYYADNDSDLGKRGQLKQTSNSIGLVTQITDYSADGQPTRMVNSNGKVTDFTYDHRGRVTRQQSGKQRIDYTYDTTGRLNKAQVNDGNWLEYGYDNAGRLITVSDQDGNRITYTLDNLGNRTNETVSGPGGARLKQIERQYNPLNQLQQISGNE